MGKNSVKYPAEVLTHHDIKFLCSTANTVTHTEREMRFTGLEGWERRKSSRPWLQAERLGKDLIWGWRWQSVVLKAAPFRRLESSRRSLEGGTHLNAVLPCTFYLAVLKCWVAIPLQGPGDIRVRGKLEASDSEICPPPRRVSHCLGSGVLEPALTYWQHPSLFQWGQLKIRNNGSIYTRKIDKRYKSSHSSPGLPVVEPTMAPTRIAPASS